MWVSALRGVGGEEVEGRGAAADCGNDRQQVIRRGSLAGVACGRWSAEGGGTGGGGVSYYSRWTSSALVARAEACPLCCGLRSRGEMR